MSEPAIPDRRLTVPEFLAWDDGTDTRYELIDGHIVAMAAPSDLRGVIAGNVYFELRGRLPRNCIVGVEMAVRPMPSDDTLFVADVVVKCGETESRPVLIVEVLSPSTARFDRTRKTDDYMTIASVRQILLIDSTRRWVQPWMRGEDGLWHGTAYIGAASVPLSFGEPMVMEALYAGAETIRE